ncbi:hypothetical protein [Streptomyces sp. NPDC057253]|uniref:hypothetical protein n=1 Tax=Streptomyces sp. NPDC057253 TaxID=3346069 RepID=UPI003632AD61
MTVALLLTRETPEDRRSVARYSEAIALAHRSRPPFCTDAVRGDLSRRMLLEVWGWPADRLDAEASARGLVSAAHAIETAKRLVPGYLEERNSHTEEEFSSAPFRHACATGHGASLLPGRNLAGRDSLPHRVRDHQGRETDQPGLHRASGVDRDPARIPDTERIAGQGATDLLAALSAVMETIELWHVEQPLPITTRGPARAVAPNCPVSARPLTIRYDEDVLARMVWEWTRSSR